MRLAFVLALLVLATSVACGDATPEIEAVAARDDIMQLKSDLVPAEILGLKVEAEDLGTELKRARPSYVEGVRLFSLRAKKLLVATLQVSLLREESDWRSSSFRRAVVNQIGGSAPKSQRMSGMTVWLTTGTKQRISIWFKERYLFVMSVREDFDRPRTLLRTALEIDP